MNQVPVGLVFPGQGTQKQGMGEPWRDAPSWELTAEVSAVTGEDLSELLLHTPGEHLRRTDLAQLAVFTLSLIAHAEAVRGDAFTGPVVACAGHSLGEYTALVAAGALTVGQGAALVAARGRAMREAALAREGTMGAVVAAPLAAVEELVREMREGGGEVWVANVNAPGQTVVSGSPETIGELAERAPSIGGKLIRLRVGGAFHSPYMAPAAEALRDALRKMSFAPTRQPVVSNVDATPYTGDGDWPAHCVRQLTSPVLWEQSVRTLTGSLGCRRLVELGPGRALAGMIRRIDSDVEVISVDAPATLLTLAVGQR
ncbi:ACP S-malonyltransferase [Streptomyces sp. WAC 01529]|uniref:ACP S-malonyltransferase n=1 Tax=Streptomyces sp. WAC 01529 TaxID=2203205 RepID=UPI000F6CF157|nr:ACP S-malonyltransferase [Streptomyces sp. WAC 01529]AZM56530.1 ACP S-malonyltransferase [Streptomyces sp. WAC 01529]